MKNFSEPISPTIGTGAPLSAPTQNNGMPRRGWILYDGECPFCVTTARRFERFFRSRGFVSLPLQTPWVQRRLGLVPGAPLEEMRVLTISGERSGGAEAVLFLARQIWYLRPLAFVGNLPLLNSALDSAYRWIATHRGCAGQCQIGLTTPKAATGSALVSNAGEPASPARAVSRPRAFEDHDPRSGAGYETENHTGRR